MDDSINRNQSERYRYIFQQSLDGIVLFDNDGSILEVNKHMADMVGYSVEEMVGKNVLNFFPPDEREPAFDRVQNADKGELVPITERTVIKKDGSSFQGDANLSPIKDETGKPLFILGTLRDISKRKQLEESIREKDTQLAQISDNLPDGVIYRLIHTPNGQRSVSYISEGVERLYGITVKEVMQDINILYGMMLPEDLEAAIQAEEDSINKHKRFDWEGRFRLPNGEIRWSRYHSKPSVLPDGTRIWDGIALDITKQKQAEKLLRDSEATAQALLNASIDVAMLTKPDGTIMALNQAATNALGGTAENLIGQNALDFFPPDVARARRIRAEEVVHTGVPVQFNDHRAEMWFRNSIYPIYNENGQVELLAIYAHNITDVQYKAVEEERIRIARELHDSVTQTLYSTAAIAEALPRIWERNQEEVQRGLGELATLTHAALAEMRTLLFELRPETLEKQNLVELLRQLVIGFRGRTSMGISLSTEADCSLPTDTRVALYRITQEALNNTVKHSRATQVQVGLDCEPGLVKLSIRDNGVGFNPQSVTSHCLGLEIMRERAQDINAVFEIKSQPDQGTLISVLWQGKQEG